MDHNNLNTMWMMICVGLVFLMQAGFLCLESGLTRSKNAINVAMKNIVDFSASFLLFWAFGFALMYTTPQSSWLSSPYLFLRLEQQSTSLVVFFLFNAMFCATAATIVSGAVAERMRFTGYLTTSIIVSALIYPMIGHWVWGGALDGQANDWLARFGFIDFAGSTVVHGVGGWSALAAALIIGPRTGRFDKQANSRVSSGHNLVLAMLGMLLLWFGWIGFNGGSTLEINNQVPKIIINTFLSGVAGIVTVLVIGWGQNKLPDVGNIINGSLAGLVAITAGCHAVSTLSAIGIGAGGAGAMLIASRFLERCQIDDAVGAFPVHAAAGVWGTIAVGLFGSPKILGTGLSQASQLIAQLSGVIVVGAVSFGTTYLLLRLAGLVIPLRASLDEEKIGLNVAEHGVSTEWFDLVMEMEIQYRNNDFKTNVFVEPNSEAGVIATQYNRTLQKIAETVAEREELSLQLIASSREAGMAEMATGVLHNVGNVLNSVNAAAALALERVSQSHVGDLDKAMALIETHRDNLGAFITTDPQGQHLPSFLRHLSQRLLDEQADTLGHLQLVTDKVDHIKEIVARQQAYATSTGVIEPLDLVALMDDALKTTDESLYKHEVEVVREYAELPLILTDRHKVLQILVNLVSNAKQALLTSDSTHKQLTVRVRDGETDQVVLEVADNGMGIASTDLTRIFQHGFTTKADGHGFGLHSSALSAKELGGCLSVHSDGPGQGAVFRLDLPRSDAPPKAHSIAFSAGVPNKRT